MSREQVKLSGGVPQTSTSVYLSEGGDLCVEMYDFSPAAQEHFGNDVAYTLVVSASEIVRIAEFLGVASLPEESRLGRLLAAIAARFESYFDIKDWLTQQQIPFTTKFEPRA